MDIINFFQHFSVEEGWLLTLVLEVLEVRSHGLLLHLEVPPGSENGEDGCNASCIDEETRSGLLHVGRVGQVQDGLKLLALMFKLSLVLLNGVLRLLR